MQCQAMESNQNQGVCSDVEPVPESTTFLYDTLGRWLQNSQVWYCYSLRDIQIYDTLYIVKGLAGAGGFMLHLMTRCLLKELTKRSPVTPGSIVGYVEVCRSNDCGTISVQLALRIRMKTLTEAGETLQTKQQWN